MTLETISPAPQAPADAKRRASRPRIGPWWVVAGLLALYLALALAIGSQSPCGNDLGTVFLPSARLVVAGEPLDIYQVRVYSYPNANGPLSEFALAGALAAGRALHLDTLGPTCPRTDKYPLPQDSIGLRMWLTLIFSLVPLGIGAEILRLSDSRRERPFTGWGRLLVWALIVLAPPLWDSLVLYGHIEQLLEIWLALIAVRFFGERRMMLSGTLLGLALLNRTAGIFVVIPLAIVLLYERRWRDVVLWGATLGAVTIAGLLPFYLTDKADLIYSLNGFRGSEPILDGSFWTFLRGTPYEARLQSLDSTVAIGLAVLVSVLIIGLGRVRSNDARLYGVICVSVCCFSLAIKAIWGYYFTEPLMWGLAWTLSARDTRQRWWHHIIVPIVMSGLMVLTEERIGATLAASNGFFNEQGGLRQMVLLTSLGECVTLCALIAGLAYVLVLRPPEAEPWRAAELEHSVVRENVLY